MTRPELEHALPGMTVLAAEILRLERRLWQAGCVCRYGASRHCYRLALAMVVIDMACRLDSSVPVCVELSENARCFEIGFLAAAGMREIGLTIGVSVWLCRPEADHISSIKCK